MKQKQTDSISLTMRNVNIDNESETALEAMVLA